MFTYSHLKQEIELFKAFGYEVGDIGNTTLNTPIPYIFLGEKDAPAMIVQGAIHAREHFTSLLIISIAKHIIRNKLNLRGGIYFVPMVNIDGVRLATEGIDIVTDTDKQKFLLDVNKGSNFSMFKANINAVDLNVNFDAKWGKGKYNVTEPASANYIGTNANSEIETINLINFTNSVNPCATISYHSKGDIIFWKFDQDNERLQRDKRYARMLSNYTSYPMVDGIDSVGGYKDWCVSKLNIPSFTIEVGQDKHELPMIYSQFDTIFNINKDVPRRLLNTIIRDQQSNN